MASSSASYAKGLKLLKHFLERECVWRVVVRGNMFCEYVAIASVSSYFVPESGEDRSGPRSICCQLMLFRRKDSHAFSLAVNGRPAGQYRCGIMKKRRCVVPGLREYYVLSFNGVLERTDLGFTPAFTVPTTVAGGVCLTPGLVYEHCALVSEEEAESIVVHDHAVDGGAVRLGGVCAWAVRRGGDLFIYAMVLTFDLYAACCERSRFPSMARLYSETVYCDSMDCHFCRDHGKHTDPVGEYLDCVADHGMCLCYAPCTTPSAKITRRDHIPFFTEQSDRAATFELKKSSFAAIGMTPDRHVCVRDGDGNELDIKCNSWNLVCVDAELSRLIILACPVLKKLAVEAD